MVLRYLLDTDICIYIRSRRPPKVLARFEKLEPGEAAISAITYGELAFGVAKSVERTVASAAMDRVLQSLEVLALPSEAGDVYGRTPADLAAAGESIGGNDLWIASHALARDLILVTNNEREFRRIAGLKIENWAR